MKDFAREAQAYPWVYLDCGFRQGRDAMLEQFRVHLDLDGFYEVDRNKTIDKFLARLKNDIIELKQRVLPYDIPQDYIDFLEYYGGLGIEGINCNFSVFGTGPMVETWYGYFNSGDHVLLEAGQLGWLSIGQLVFHAGHKHDYNRVLFYIDLAGVIQTNSIIGIAPWAGTDPDELDILKNIHEYPSMWSKTASSFTEFLELAVETRGEFAY